MSIKSIDPQLLKPILQGYISENTEVPSTFCDSSTDGTQYLGLPTEYEGSYKYFFVLETTPLRRKFVELSFTTLIRQTFVSLAVIIYELFHAITFCCTLNRRFSSICERLLATGCLLLHIVSIPLAIIGMQCVALYGIASPERARTYYAKLEGWIYIRTEMYNIEICCGRKPFFSFLTLPFYPIPVIQRYVGC